MEQALQFSHNMRACQPWPAPYYRSVCAPSFNTNRVACFAERMRNGSLHIDHHLRGSCQFACFAKKGMHSDGVTVVTEGLDVDTSSSSGSLHQQVNKGSLMVEERPVIESLLEVDSVTEAELKEKGLKSTRRTKLVCTIGPACCSPADLEAMAMGGMNVARINMCHNTRAWHAQVIRNIRKLNAEKGYNVAIMMDTEGSEVHMGELGGASSVKTEEGEVWVFTLRKMEGPPPPRTVHVNCEGFAEAVIIGDELVVDGGMARFEVINMVGPDVHCRCNYAGLLLPRANITFWRAGRPIRDGNSMLPTISSKDW
eukprot:c15985_g1_i1 orf=256-1191(+)